MRLLHTEILTSIEAYEIECNETALIEHNLSVGQFQFDSLYCNFVQESLYSHRKAETTMYNRNIFYYSI